jgi:hypothetical protein
MALNRRLAPLALLMLAATLTLGGCKSNNQQQQESQNAQPSQNPQSSANLPPTSGASSAPPSAQPAQQAAPQAPPPPAVIDLPRGTAIRVRLDQDLGSKISQPGDSFTATVADDVRVNGKVVIPKEARADGTVIDAKPLGRFKGGAVLSIRLDRVRTKWGSYPVETSSIARAEKGKGKRSAGFIGGGAGLGAIIGGLAGGGKGAVIGGLAGAGAGTAGSAFTGNHQIVLPAETLLTFRLDHSVHITEVAQQQPQLQQR